MGTYFSTNLTADKDSAQNLSDEIIKAGNELEDRISRRISSSEIGLINSLEGEEAPIPISDRLRQVIEMCLSVSAESDGAFDITVGSLTELWQIDELSAETDSSLKTPPAENEISEARSNCGYDKIKLTDDGLTIARGTKLDLGGVGKGLFLDEAATLLSGTDVSGTVVAGGSVLTYGSKPGGEAWHIAVADPFSSDERYGILDLVGTHFISTSGGYERNFEYNGTMYHHILNPLTGYPADSDLASVTIVCDNGLLSDALSTAVFVLGSNKGMVLLEKYDAEAILILRDGSVIATDGLRECFRR